MVLIKIISCAIIFTTRLRFPSGVSIATICAELSANETQMNEINVRQALSSQKRFLSPRRGSNPATFKSNQKIVFAVLNITSTSVQKQRRGEKNPGV